MGRGGAGTLERSWARGRPFARRRNGGHRRRRLRAWARRAGPARGGDGLRRIAGEEPPRLPVGPGELFSYCNVGFWRVGAAVARASGLTFQAAMGARVLEPLDLGATDFEPRQGARGHEQAEPG